MGITAAVIVFQLFTGEAAKNEKPVKAPAADNPSVDTLSEGGAELFRNYCAPCHAQNLVLDLTGPALFGVTERRSMDWLIRYTRNSFKMVEEGDSIAIQLWNEWKPTLMTPFPNLPEKDIRELYASSPKNRHLSGNSPTSISSINNYFSTAIAASVMLWVC